MGEYLEKLLEQTATMRAPLSGDEPAGVDLNLEPELERVKGELEKLSNLDGGDVDWRLVVETCEPLLATRTKDLRVAAWLTAAGIERSGWDGLARGLVVLRAFVVEQWEPIFPKRDKARGNIVVWLAERVAPKLGDLAVRLEDGEAVRTCSALVDEIDRTLSDKLGDGFGSIRGLVQGCRSRVRDIPEPPPPPPPAPEPEPEPSKVAVAASTDDDDAPAPPSNRAPAPPPVVVQGPSLSTRPEDAATSTRVAAEALTTLARAMVSGDPSRAWAYRIHRSAIWLPLERIVVEGGVAHADAPSVEVRFALGQLLATGRWLEVILTAEEASARAPLWLDAQHFVATALERLGAPFVQAREVVGREASDFARRHSHLLDARFPDGTPLATPETIAWLEAEGARWQLDASRVPDAAREETAEIARRFAEATELVAAGRPTEGLALATWLARRAVDPRERFRWNLEVASLARRAGALDVARPILLGLLQVVETHQLDTWEPTLAASLYEALLGCLPDDAQERPKLFESLCRIDPSAALRARQPGATMPSLLGPSTSAFGGTFGTNVTNGAPANAGGFGGGLAVAGATLFVTNPLGSPVPSPGVSLGASSSSPSPSVQGANGVNGTNGTHASAVPAQSSEPEPDYSNYDDD